MAYRVTAVTREQIIIITNTLTGVINSVAAVLRDIRLLLGPPRTRVSERILDGLREYMKLNSLRNYTSIFYSASCCAAICGQSHVSQFRLALILQIHTQQPPRTE